MFGPSPLLRDVAQINSLYKWYRMARVEGIYTVRGDPDLEWDTWLCQEVEPRYLL